MLLESGERVAVDQQRTPQRSYGSRFVIMFTQEAARIAESIEHASTLRVLFLLPEYLDFDAFKRLDQNAVAKRLGISRPAVTRAMQELHKRQVIEREGTGPVTTWRLSLHFGWNGNVESYHAARSRRARPAQPPAPRVVAREGILWKFLR